MKIYSIKTCQLRTATLNPTPGLTDRRIGNLGVWFQALSSNLLSSELCGYADTNDSRT